MRNHRSLALLSAVLGMSLVLAGCGDGGPSVRAEPVTTTSEPTITSSTAAPTTTTTTPTAPVPDGQQLVRYRGVQLLVPSPWPVHDLSAQPRTCVRVDVHAVYLGTPGVNQDCPAHPIGHTETVLLSPLEDASEIAVGRATRSTTLNGLAVRVDPAPDAVGQLTVVFPDLQLVAFVTFGADRSVADQLLAGLGPAS